MVGGCDFLSKLHEPGVVTDVRVRDQYGINGSPSTLRSTCKRMQHVDLGSHCWRGFD